MRVLRALALAATVLLASCAGMKDTSGTQDVLDPRLVPAAETADRGHLIVTVPLEGPDALAEVADRLERDYPIRLVAEWPLGAIQVHCFVFRVTADTNVEQLARALEESEAVAAAQQMQSFRPLAGLYADEHYQLQQGLLSINAPKAHALSTGRNVRIAIVDTGVDVNHPDLASRIDMARDFVGVGSSPPPGELHGTAIAGVIAADAGNGKGIVGVAPDARLMALRGCWEERAAGRCSSFSLARAMNFAVLNRADIVNLSLAGPYDPLLSTLIDAALGRGIIVVAARGREAEGRFPASMAGVISAGAAQPANGGAEQSVPAPDIDVITTAPGGGYDFSSGSSVSAAHVSGVAALLLQRAPDMTPADLRSSLMESVRDNAEQTGPMLDACLAVVSVLSQPPASAC